MNSQSLTLVCRGHNRASFGSVTEHVQLSTKKLKKIEEKEVDMDTIIPIFLLPYFDIGSHWLMEIIQLLYNGGDRSKVDQSNLNTALEMCNEQVDVENNASVPGYKKMADWDSPRIIQTHCFKDLLPPQVWQKKTKVYTQA